MASVQRSDEPTDGEVDVVVVGGGAAALTAAATAARTGARVVVLEAADKVGGTTAKSSGGFWIPNNRVMRERGFKENRAGCLAHMALLAYPNDYERHADRHGLTEDAWELIVNYFDTAVLAIEDLEANGDLTYMIMESFRGDDNGMPPWFVTEPDGVKYGRLLAPTPGEGSEPSDVLAVFTARGQGSNKGVIAMRSRGASQGDGADLVRQLLQAGLKYGVEVRVNHRVVDVVTDQAGAVVGVVAETENGIAHLGARQGVVFGSGGLEHNADLRARFLRGPIVGSCGAGTNRGDFIAIAERLGAALANTQEAWWSELPLEPCLDSFEQGELMSTPYGDSMILVNSAGERVVNEKLLYNERGKAHFVRDDAGGFPNYLLFQVFDDAVVENEMPWPGRWPVPYRDDMPDYVLTGETIPELAAAIAQRLVELAPRAGDFALKPEFSSTLQRTIARFNQFANQGHDEDFGRGDSLVDRYFSPEWREVPTPNHTMYPFAAAGPYYAVILGASCLGTKGGPKVNTRSQVMRPDGTSIPGLYGAGNCIASPAGEAYWGGGGTLGPAIVHGYLAGQAVCTEPIRSTAGIPTLVPAQV